MASEAITIVKIVLLFLARVSAFALELTIRHVSAAISAIVRLFNVLLNLKESSDCFLIRWLVVEIVGHIGLIRQIGHGLRRLVVLIK
jgi:hypothetical protein